MKKLVFGVFVFIFASVLTAHSAIVAPIAEGEFQEYINKTGFKLLNFNKTEQHIIFKYSDDNSIIGSVNYNDMSVSIPKGLIYNIESEDELAAVIAMQIAYGMIYKENKFSKFNIKTSPKKYELLSDKMAIDMLVNAQFSPIALITIINKTYGEQYNKKFSKHVKTSVRLANIYEYIVRKYPLELDKYPFKNNLYYQNFLLNSRKNRELLQEKLQKKPTEHIKDKYR